jgi:hypothetical protein
MVSLARLEGHLDFIGRFYNAAAQPFETTKRKIEVREEPFVPSSALEDCGHEPYEIEWMEADDCLCVLGNCALGLVEKALHDYLREFVERSGGRKPMKKKGSWFDRFCHFLEEHTTLSWTNSPVSRDQIEQINLSRNDISHHPVIDRIQPRQTDYHFGKYPMSRFAAEWDIKVMSGEQGKPEFPLILDITSEKLTAAIADVRQFCAFVEAQRKGKTAK